MALLLLRITALVLAAIFFFQSIRDLIVLLRRPKGTIGKDGSGGWPNSISRLGVCLVLIAIASDEPHRNYPFAIIGAGIILIVIAGVLRRRESRRER